MQTLPDFQKKVFDLHEAATRVFQDKNEIFLPMAQEFESRKQECINECNNYGPKIMFFGTYNAGKSTLLNALMGSEVAETGDVPLTKEIHVYDWNGYKIIDTPGINAPIEHEEITLEQLKHADIILFVVSSQGSFEDIHIYERMNDILSMNKDLIVIINNKDGLPFESLQLGDIKNKVIDNLQKMTNKKDILQKVQYITVNALDALDGRIEKENELVNDSNIVSVEETILQKLKNLNTFEPLQRLLDNFGKTLQQSSHTLDALVVKNKEEESVSSKIQNTCVTSMNVVLNNITSECATLSLALFALLPKPEVAENVDQAVLQVSISQKVEEYKECAQNILKRECQALSIELGTYIKEAEAQSTSFSISHDETLDIPDIALKKSIEKSTFYFENSDTENPLSELSNNAIPLIPAGLKIFSIPVTVIIAIATAVFDIFLRKSKDATERARIDAEIRAKNEEEERRSRQIEMWRKEARENCTIYAESVTRKLRNIAQEQHENFTRQFIDRAKQLEQYEDAKQQEAMQLRNACYDLVKRTNAVLNDLK